MISAGPNLAVFVMSVAFLAQWLPQPSPGTPAQAPDPGQIDTPRSREIFDQDALACPGTAPECGSKILVSPPRGGVSARTLAHKHSKAASKAFDRGSQAWKKGQAEEALGYLIDA